MIAFSFICPFKSLEPAPYINTDLPWTMLFYLMQKKYRSVLYYFGNFDVIEEKRKLYIEMSYLKSVTFVRE
jgi:hypothetical protein